MEMSYPVILPLSPVCELFQSVPTTNKIIRVLSFLPDLDKKFLLIAEDNPLDYTLYDQVGAERYITLLLKVLHEIFITSNLQRSRKVCKIVSSSENDVTSGTDLSDLSRIDPTGVLGHYIVSRLTESVQSLKQRPKGAKATFSSTFYPSGILLHGWKTLLQIASDESVADQFIQRGCCYCLSCILVEGTTMEVRNLLFSSISSPVNEYVDWLISQLQLSAKTLSTVLPALTTIITSASAKMMLGRQGCVGYICHHLRVKRSLPSRNKQISSQWRTDEDLDESPGQLAYDSLRSIQLTPIRSVEGEQRVVTSQQQYELLYCLWVISLEVKISCTVREYFHREGAIPVLADLIAVSPREKVTRLSISILKNLAQCDDDSLSTILSTTTSTTSTYSCRSSQHSLPQLNRIRFLEKMIGCGILKSIQFMTTCVWNDQEMQNDLEILHIMLVTALERMTQWDMYQAEVESGYLRWGTVHESDFFRKYIKRFEGPDGNFVLVQKLVELVRQHSRQHGGDNDEDVVAIACYDIGEFVRLYPQGKTIIKQFDARNVIVNAYNQYVHNDIIRHNALICLSKMLITNWKHITT